MPDKLGGNVRVIHNKLDRFIEVFSNSIRWQIKNATSAEVRHALEYVQKALQDTQRQLLEERFEEENYYEKM